MSKPTSHSTNSQRERGHLQDFQYGNVHAFHRQPSAHGREREREAEENVGVIRKPLRQRIKTNHHERDRREIKHSGLRKWAGGNQSAPDKNPKCNRPVSDICPVGKWRLVVRGFSASNLRSTIRLKASHRCARRPSPRESVQTCANRASHGYRARDGHGRQCETAGRRRCAGTGRTKPIF